MYLFCRVSGHEASIEELQAEMKLLNWHKLANEAALKVAFFAFLSFRLSSAHFGLTKPNHHNCGIRLQ
jgi:hypothetical protein